MGRYEDNAPVGHTCPDINEAQNISSNVIDTIDASLSVFQETKDYLNGLIQQLELLRSENSTLRDWGNECHDLCESLEDDVSELTRENEDLKNENAQLKDEIEDLKQEWRLFRDESYEKDREIEQLQYNLDRQ